jgi:hypothetical protein
MSPPASSRLVRLHGVASTPLRVAVCLLVVAGAATAAHIAFALRYHGPWVFDDELGYERLAHSIGTTGRMALFGDHGLSYPPLYPVVLAPVYALHLSGPQAYDWVKVVNCLLMASSVLPVYKIARFVLSPGHAAAAAGLTLLAPLMLYSALEMSESLAYPVCLFAFWAMLVTIRSPSRRHDLAVVGTCALATASRIQLAALLPAALAAIVLEPALAGGGFRAGLRRSLKAHRLLVAATGGLLLLGLAAVAGTEVLSLAGRYANQRSAPRPSPWILTRLVSIHAAGLVFAVVVVPFAGTLVAAYLFLRSRRPPRVTAFAAVSLSVTAVLTAFAAYATFGQEYYSGATDPKRIHERYFMYVLPLFVIAMLATTQLPRSDRLRRVGLIAAAATGLIAAVIPYGEIINNGVASDTFGLSPLAASAARGGIEPFPHATLVAVAYALLFGVIYALARPNVVLVVAVVAVSFVLVSLSTIRVLDGGARTATAHTLPARRDWVDAAVGRRSGVAVLQLPRRNVTRDLAVAETAFFNLSVSRLYYACSRLLSPEFGEQEIELDRAGHVQGPAGPLVTRYVVAPAGHGVAGRVIAVDAPGHLVLLEPAGGVVRIAPGARALWSCRKGG